MWASTAPRTGGEEEGEVWAPTAPWTGDGAVGVECSAGVEVQASTYLVVVGEAGTAVVVALFG